jgi:hypothetical protein
MTEEELRSLVRQAIARHAGRGAVAGSPQPSGPLASGSLRMHPSHGLFGLPVGSDSDGPCLIEPAVMCNHCGYCKSYGH